MHTLKKNNKASICVTTTQFNNENIAIHLEPLRYPSFIFKKFLNTFFLVYSQVCATTTIRTFPLSQKATLYPLAIISLHVNI